MPGSIDKLWADFYEWPERWEGVPEDDVRPGQCKAFEMPDRAQARNRCRVISKYITR